MFQEEGTACARDKRPEMRLCDRQLNMRQRQNDKAGEESRTESCPAVNALKTVGSHDKVLSREQAWSYFYGVGQTRYRESSEEAENLVRLQHGAG